MLLQKYSDKVLKRLIFYYRLVGCWRPVNTSLGYYIYGIFYLVCFPGLLSFFMLMNVVLLTDMSQLTYALYMFLTQTCGVIKFISFYYYNHGMQDLVQRAETFHLKNQSEGSLVEKRINSLVKPAAIYVISALTALHTNQIVSFLSTERRLAYSAWYPFFDWENSLRDYVIVSGYTHVAIISATTLITFVDIFLSFMFTIIAVQLEIIGLRLQQIGQKKELIDRQNDFAMFVVENMELHQKAIVFKRLVEQYFSMAFFCQLVASAIVISSIVREMSRVS